MVVVELFRLVEREGRWRPYLWKMTAAEAYQPGTPDSRRVK